MSPVSRGSNGSRELVIISIELHVVVRKSWPLELAPFGLELSRVNPGNSIASQIGVGFRIVLNLMLNMNKVMEL